MWNTFQENWCQRLDIFIETNTNRSVYNPQFNLCLPVVTLVICMLLYLFLLTIASNMKKWGGTPQRTEESSILWCLCTSLCCKDCLPIHLSLYDLNTGLTMSGRFSINCTSCSDWFLKNCIQILNWIWIEQATKRLQSYNFGFNWNILTGSLSATSFAHIFLICDYVIFIMWLSHFFLKKDLIIIIW